VIAPSFSGLYFRNAFNLGLLLLTCEQAGELQEGERIAFDARAARIERADGQVLDTAPIPGFLLDMVEAGGLLAQLQQRFKPGTLA
jgi:3-isopropylmalate/(R)-2-methylmalate dehydratase small subunit